MKRKLIGNAVILMPVRTCTKNQCLSFDCRVLHMLHEADPTGEIEDPAELGGLEGVCLT